MNDIEYETQKARVQALADKWLLPLGLKYWMVSLDFDRTTHVEKDENAADNWAEVACCRVRWEYLQANMVWRLLVVEDLSDEQLERHFIHECMHVFLNEMRETDENMKHEERVAELLANAFWWVHTTMTDRDVHPPVATAL